MHRRFLLCCQLLSSNVFHYNSLLPLSCALPMPTLPDLRSRSTCHHLPLSHLGSFISTCFIRPHKLRLHGSRFICQAPYSRTHKNLSCPHIRNYSITGVVNLKISQVCSGAQIAAIDSLLDEAVRQQFHRKACYRWRLFMSQMFLAPTGMMIVHFQSQSQLSKFYY